MPLVSAIMTIRNGEAYLAEAIDSLFAQSLSDIEVVVNDNGSTDGTQAILAGYQDSRLKVLPVDSARQGSFADGISRAFDHAEGTYVAVLDSDDVAHPRRFAAQVEFLRSQPDVGLVGSAMQWIDENGKGTSIYRPEIDPDALAQEYAWSNPIPHSSVMYRRDLASRLGGYDTTFKFACDYKLALSILNAGYKVASLPDILVRIRQHAGRVTRQDEHSLMRNHDKLELMASAQSLSFLDARARVLGRRELVKTAVHYARDLVCAGRVHEARIISRDGRRRDPMYYLLYAGYQALRGNR